MADNPADSYQNQPIPPSIPETDAPPGSFQPATDQTPPVSTPPSQSDSPIISGVDPQPTTPPVEPETIPSKPQTPPESQPEPISPTTPPVSPPETPKPETPTPPPEKTNIPEPVSQDGGESFTVSESKKSSPLLVGGALVLLLMAATMPAALNLVKTQTNITPRAQEEITLPSPTPKPPKTQTTYTPLTAEDQQEEWVQDLKPQNVKVTTPSKGTAKITFTTNQAFPSSILYSSNENWNYLTMFLQGDKALDEWHQYEFGINEKTASPEGGKEPQTEHEYMLNDLTSGQKYLFVIQIEVLEQKEIFEFGLEQPEHYYTFTAK